jgi:hypothetical protein
MKRDVRERTSGRRWAATWRTGIIAIGLMVALPARPFAHEIPPSVALVAFVKPETGRLRLLVRVPLEAIRDVDFPQRGAGYLDIARTTPLLRDAANVWIADYVEMYENDRRLERGGIVATRVSLPSDRAFATYDNRPAVDVTQSAVWEIQDEKVATPSAQAQDDELARGLWERSAELVGLPADALR